MYPYPNPSLLKQGLSFMKNIKWASLLDGTQKTLGVINQAIPIVYQVKPMVSNAKTLLKIVNGVTNESPSTSKKKESIPKEEKTINKPIFYI